MAVGPPESKKDWLYRTVSIIDLRTEVIMASLEELKAQAAATRSRVDELAAAESTQSAAIAGLAGAVDSLIVLVGELRKGLSPEEQALADEVMTEIANTLKATDTALAGSGLQSTAIGDLATRATAAGNTPPAT